jgi:hypothetical protein
MSYNNDDIIAILERLLAEMTVVRNERVRVGAYTSESEPIINLCIAMVTVIEIMLLEARRHKKAQVKLLPPPARRYNNGGAEIGGAEA